MSTIYSLPTTIIQTNGSRVYKLKTRDYDGILHAVEIESKTSDTINLDFEDLYFQSIAFKGNSDLGETTLKCIRETLDVKNYYLVDSRPLTCDNSLKEEYLPELQFLIGKGYVIDIPMPVITSITVTGPSRITEIGDYDFYADIYPADAPFDNIRWVGSSEGYAINFEVDPNNPKHCILHVVDYIEYNNYQLYCINDDPYVYGYAQFDIEAKKPPVHIESMTISGPTNIDAPGIYDYYVEISPDDVTEYSIGWDTWSNKYCRTIVDPSNPLHISIEVFEYTDRDTYQANVFAIDNVTRISATKAVEISYSAGPIFIQSIEITGPSSITSPGIYDYYATYTPDDADTYNIVWNSHDERHYRTIPDPTDPLHCQLEVFESSSSFRDSLYMVVRDTVRNLSDTKYTTITIEVQQIYINSISVTGPSEITKPGIYDYYATFEPSNANRYELGWYTTTSGYFKSNVDLNDPLHLILEVYDPEDKVTMPCPSRIYEAYSGKTGTQNVNVRIVKPTNFAFDGSAKLTPGERTNYEITLTPNDANYYDFDVYTEGNRYPVTVVYDKDNDPLHFGIITTPGVNDEFWIRVRENYRAQYTYLNPKSVYVVSETEAIIQTSDHWFTANAYPVSGQSNEYEIGISPADANDFEFEIYTEGNSYPVEIVYDKDNDPLHFSIIPLAGYEDRFWLRVLELKTNRLKGRYCASVI